ncbi:MAG: WbqC family protein [Saprospiraceae bacterium]|nr:WbqC family protein [Saprospiraceae bacterium]
MLFNTSILTTEYFPPISTFWAMLNSEHIRLEHCENYQKKSTRNRAKILGANGIEVLSIPLHKGKNNKMPIKEVKISYEDKWQSKHLHSIRSAYGNAPYFEFYIDDIKAIINRQFDSLMELNQSLLLFFIRALQIELSIAPTENYQMEYNPNDIDLRNVKFNAEIMNGYSPKIYNQVFEEKHGFVGGISILDLLMCKGPESILYI